MSDWCFLAGARGERPRSDPSHPAFSHDPHTLARPSRRLGPIISLKKQAITGSQDLRVSLIPKLRGPPMLTGASPTETLPATSCNSYRISTSPVQRPSGSHPKCSNGSSASLLRRPPNSTIRPSRMSSLACAGLEKAFTLLASFHSAYFVTLLSLVRFSSFLLCHVDGH
jgi:hypothetical protein